jgi:protein-disulfide isomerase
MPLLVTLVFVVLASTAIASFPKEPVAGVPAAAGKSGVTSTAGKPTSDEENFDDAWSKQPRVDLGIPADGAKVVIVKFNDWQCPSCKAAYYQYKPLLDKYAESMPGAIKQVTKDYPLNSRCNFNLPTQMHAGACESAVAVRIAAEHHQADSMIEWLFSHQETLTPQTVEAQVKSTLGVTDFDREYARLLPDIKRDAADGAALHVQYTPTYYVNGVKAQLSNGSWLPAQYFDYAIQYELRHPNQSAQPPNK